MYFTFFFFLWSPKPSRRQPLSYSMHIYDVSIRVFMLFFDMKYVHASIQETETIFGLKEKSTLERI